MWLGITGDIIFAAAVVTMRDSWRAGIAEEHNREMITSGIYKISRNPAFFGVGCVYLGILILFFYWILLFFSVFAAVMLHLQILQEEKYLPVALGEEYISYKKTSVQILGKERINGRWTDGDKKMYQGSLFRDWQRRFYR